MVFNCLYVSPSITYQLASIQLVVAEWIRRRASDSIGSDF